MKNNYKDNNIEKFYDNYDDLFKELEKLKNEGFVFRGQGNYVHGITSTLERVNTNNQQTYNELEQNILTLFKRSAGNYFENHYIDMNKGLNLELMSFMRHYEVDSRLVDFSFSPYVSLFFSCINSLESDGSIFAINVREINKIADSILGSVFGEVVGTEEWFNKIIQMKSNSEPPILIAVRPNISNKRIHAQQGLFICVSNPNFKFEDLIFNKEIYKCFVQNDYILRFKINKNLKENLLKKLIVMNVTYDNLYPDFVGFVKHLSTQAILFNPKTSPEVL
ncbi:MAG: FRG domain-containing protein [Candidatus Sericytochromatia bacterium]